MSIQDAIRSVAARQDLSQAEAAAAMEEIMSGSATPAQIGALLTALAMKGETEAEIAGMAEVMRARAVPVPVDGPLVDTCGTGGDGANTFNISTCAALVAAGAGVRVAKHGNRAMTSRCGSADVLEGLGVLIELEAEGVAQCIREAGIGFMFAPKFHPAMRYAGPVRREIGIRSAFNVLGPLTNPAHARHQVLGVPSAQLAELLAGALSRLDTVHALVVHGAGGLDELSLAGPSMLIEVRAGQAPRRFELDPRSLGLEYAPIDALLGGTRDQNVALVRRLLSGDARGPQRDVVLLNAAAALLAADLVDDFREGLRLAAESLDHGAAADRLNRLIRASHATGIPHT